MPTALRSSLALAKPRITVLVSLTAGAGYWLASPRGGLDVPRLLWTLAGVALASASTGCLNQVLEAEHDARMKRTSSRPIPSGAVPPGAAHALGLLWGAAGLGLLAWKAGPTACALTALTLASYLLVYTPMKRFSSISMWVGAVPGALPPVIGWTAAGGGLDGGAAALFALLYVWQIPHFLALGWMLREDYARGGFKVASTVDPSGFETSWQMAASTAALLAVSVLPYAAGLAGVWYLAAAAVLGAWFMRASAKAALELTDAAAKRAFLASVAYLPLLLAVLALDKR